MDGERDAHHGRMRSALGGFAGAEPDGNLQRRSALTEEIVSNLDSTALQTKD